MSVCGHVGREESGKPVLASCAGGFCSFAANFFEDGSLQEHREGEERVEIVAKERSQLWRYQTVSRLVSSSWDDKRRETLGILGRQCVFRKFSVDMH